VAIANRAKEFIELHWQENLTLEQIAAHVLMSPFHFQRIFKKETGETPKEYLTRLRIEGAVHLLRAFPEMSVYEVVMDSGFSSQSVFARAFHQKFGMSATEFRNLSFSEVAKLSVWDPGIRRFLLSELHTKYSPRERKKFLASVTVKRIQPIDVIYAPTTMKSEGHIADAFQSLVNHAEVYDLITPDAEYYGLMYDFALHTPLEKCRYKVCLSVPEGAVVHSKFFRMKINGGKYATFPFKGNFETMIELSLLFFNDWLSERQYTMAELRWFERFRTLPAANTYSTMMREIYIPIKPA
jgi:AraC family transcriptional regulator